MDVFFFFSCRRRHTICLSDWSSDVCSSDLEQELCIGKLWWTSFYIGCLENKDEVCRFNTRPRFRIIDSIGRHGISKGDILYLNRRGYFERVPFAISVTEFDVKFDQGQQLQSAELFKHPIDVDL